MVAKVAINGLGRIGRATLKVVRDTPELDLVAVNDIAPADNIAYLIKYDSVYGRYGEKVEAKDGKLHIDGDEYAFLAERDPAQLPWKELGVDIVIESTGFFTDKDGASKHLEAGARHVIISAPTKSEGVPTVVFGVNTEEAGTQVISCASCTTNSITPVVEVIGRYFGIQKAILTTIHSYTASQHIVDSPDKNFRRGRSGAVNMVPTTTGAAIATTKALPQYHGKFDGLSVRVPTPVGSLSDLVFLTEKDVTVEQVNDALRQEAAGKYKDIMRVTDDPIVSSDIIGDPHACILDLQMTKVVAGNLVKIFSWYDNEWGYTNQMVRKAKEIAQSL